VAIYLSPAVWIRQMVATYLPLAGKCGKYIATRRERH